MEFFVSPWFTGIIGAFLLIGFISWIVEKADEEGIDIRFIGLIFWIPIKFIITMVLFPIVLVFGGTSGKEK